MSFECSSWAVRQDVQPSGRKFVLVILATWANQDGVCWGLQETIANHTGQSVRSVREHLAALKGAGYLKRQKRFDREGHRRSDAYTLDPEDKYALKDWIELDRDPAPERRRDAPREGDLEENPAARDEEPTGSSRHANRQLSPSQPEDSAGGPNIEERSIERSGKDQGGARARDAPDLLNEFEEDRNGGQCEHRGGDHGKSKRGRRLPTDWRPSAAHYALGASAELGLGPERVDFEADKFRDHWAAESGPKAVKRDWDRAFNNWLRNAPGFDRRHDPGRNRRGHGGDVAAVLSLLDQG